MTDPVEPVEVHSETEAHHVVVTNDTSKEKFFVFKQRFVYLVVGGFIIATVVGAWAFYSLFKDQQQQVSTGQVAVAELTEDVRLLREQLGDAQRQLNTSRAETDDRTSCRGAYNNKVSEATSLTLIEMTQLFVVLAARTPETTADEFVQPIAEIEAAGVALKQAQADRAAYEKASAPLPCPIPSTESGG